MNREEDTIDLGRLLSIIVANKKVTGGIVVVCTVLAIVISLLLPKTYTSSVMVQTGSSKSAISSGAAALAAMTGAATGKAGEYIEIMKTRTVLEPIIASVYDDMDADEQPTVENFAKSNLDIKNTKGTNLIQLDAKGRTPEEAHEIAQGVVDNFLKLMTDMNYQSQSLMVKFLNERSDVAQKEADEAAQKLEDYSKEHKVYVPDEQTKAMMERMAAYDKTMGELAVQRQSAGARFASVSSQLGEQNANAVKYSMADNDVVTALRNKIVAKEVELVKLRQLYTEEHPDVINAKKELQSMQQNVADEVAAAVAAEIVPVSSTQGSLVAERYQAATAMAVAQAAEAAVREQQSKVDSDMEKLADDSLGYMKLARDAEIKQQVHAELVKQAESAKIQQAVESMDIQVVDPASMPREDKPSGPRKKLIAAIGFVIGCMISLGYSLVLYKREG
ncbi:chain-length determining protein [Veillonellaceae bacterium WCA-693-APC-5D-A]|uniref:Chain-length determining protein n=1 Tax=Anaerovibrio slackiae TaxID=2652309 RepID=A0A6I2UKT5_9FIRM|nr:Wzz/FepE/Etk N-terminal domain-containing protein [Anaerovibrio slackiae]MSU09612.1 chain-length determining protein [Anaerovibrio slackiae]